MGYRNQKAMIDALKASNGDVVGALGFLADEQESAQNRKKLSFSPLDSRV
jgi:hypothetical protein